MTQRGAIFTPDTAKIVLEVVRYLRSNGFIIDRGGRGGQFIAPPTPIFVRNDSGEEVPPFACMQSTGTVENGGQNYVAIDKPADTTATSGVYLFNGFQAIESGGFGIANDGPLVRVLTDGSAISSGARWQPTVNSWTASPGGTMFTAVGGDDIASDVMWASVVDSAATLYGFTLTSAGFVTTTSATANIYPINGGSFGTILESDASIYDPAGWALGSASGATGLCIKQGGIYYAIQAACE